MKLKKYYVWSKIKLYIGKSKNYLNNNKYIKINLTDAYRNCRLQKIVLNIKTYSHKHTYMKKKD